MLEEHIRTQRIEAITQLNKSTKRVPSITVQQRASGRLELNIPSKATHHSAPLLTSRNRQGCERMAQEHAFALCRARSQLLWLQYACKIYLLKNVSLGMAFCHVAVSLFASVLEPGPPSSP